MEREENTLKLGTIMMCFIGIGIVIYLTIQGSEFTTILTKAGFFYLMCLGGTYFLYHSVKKLNNEIKSQEQAWAKYYELATTRPQIPSIKKDKSNVPINNNNIKGHVKP